MGSAVRSAAQLVAAADAMDVPVIHVHHESVDPNAALFAAGSQGVESVTELPVPGHHHRIVKHLPSSFHQTSLAPLLERLGIEVLVIAGCMTHNCVDSTARDAMHRNYTVAIAGDACATRDLPGVDGTVIAAQQVHIATLSALADRHAEVAATEFLILRLLATSSESVAVPAAS